MTREESFRKNFPEYCRGEECLSPYFDLFCAGLEIEKSQMYEKTVKSMQEQIEKMKCCRNCVHFDFTEPNYCHKGVYRANQNVCGEWCFGN